MRGTAEKETYAARVCWGGARTADTRPRAAWRAWQESRPPERRASCGWSGAGVLGWGIKTTAIGGTGWDRARTRILGDAWDS